jgi:beta-phosphoglucomutase-like phosphatase (HAD superfamily)
MPKITTILFDCDNTLVLSEPLAFAACSELANAILAQYAPSVTHRYNAPEMQKEFVGKNFRALMAALEVKHGFTMPPEDVEGWTSKELGTTIGYIKAQATPCTGSMEVLEDLRAEGRYKLAIVSSSAFERVIASVRKTSQDVYFDAQPPADGSELAPNSDRVFSAASMVPPNSKPDPAVYLYACEKLGVAPGECVAVEDSRSGATAAKRAGIHLMGYVGPYYDEGQEEVDEAVKTLGEEVGAEVVMHHWKDFTECLKVIEDK